MSEELKPCPFCGSKADLHQFTRKRWSVDCSACGAAMISGSTKCDAIENWNTRAQAAPEAEPVAWQWVYANGGTSPVYMGKGPDAEFVAAGLAAEFPRRVRYLYTAPQHDAELVELLAKLRQMVCATPENDLNRSGVWISTKHPVIEHIDAKLATLRHV